MAAAVASVILNPFFCYRTGAVIIFACPGKVFGCLAALSAPHDVLLILITATQTKTERTARLLKVALPLPRYSFSIFPPVKSKEKTGRVCLTEKLEAGEETELVDFFGDLNEHKTTNERKSCAAANMSEMMKALQR
jgi:hypothetical protein